MQSYLRFATREGKITLSTLMLVYLVETPSFGLCDKMLRPDLDLASYVIFPPTKRHKKTRSRIFSFDKSSIKFSRYVEKEKTDFGETSVKRAKMAIGKISAK